MNHIFTVLQEIVRIRPRMACRIAALLGCAFCLCSGSAPPQKVIINEVALNGSTAADENGDYPDWLELYNASPEPIHLDGYGLSDERGEPFKWSFRRATLKPRQFLVVFDSGKDRQPQTAAKKNPENLAGLKLWFTS